MLFCMLQWSLRLDLSPHLNNSPSSCSLLAPSLQPPFSTLAHIIYSSCSCRCKGQCRSSAPLGTQIFNSAWFVYPHYAALWLLQAGLDLFEEICLG